MTQTLRLFSHYTSLMVSYPFGNSRRPKDVSLKEEMKRSGRQRPAVAESGCGSCLGPARGQGRVVLAKTLKNSLEQVQRSGHADPQRRRWTLAVAPWRGRLLTQAESRMRGHAGGCWGKLGGRGFSLLTGVPASMACASSLNEFPLPTLVFKNKS